MGSAAVQHLVTDDRIHVGFDKGSKMWWAVGKLGSYGGHRSHAQAVKIAEGAAGRRGRVVLHNTSGKIVGTRAGKDAGSQFFQDAVP
jgi:hypothetical protein